MLRRTAFLAGLAAALVGLLATGAAGRGSAPAPFPVTIIASNGKVTVKKRPVRIVPCRRRPPSRSSRIGACKQVVAVDDQSDYPKAAPRTSLSGFTPNVEAIAATGPTSSSSRTTRKGSPAPSVGSGSPLSTTTVRARSPARTSRSCSWDASPGTSPRRTGSSGE